MSTARMIWSVILLTAATVSAQSIVAVNSTVVGVQSSNGAVALQVVHSEERGAAGGVYDLIPLTSAAAAWQPNEQKNGPIVLANESSQLSLSDRNVALINCDRYSGNIQAIDVFKTATERNVTAIVFYSTDEASCKLDDVQTDYTQIYTMKSREQTSDMLRDVNSVNVNGQSIAVGRIALSATLLAESNGNTVSQSNSSSGHHGQQGFNAPPSTAVAMIILYSITGVITALFLIIIVTGAVRAHRHPERYGPRNIMGRPRQSRARGLARAMLETLPIVRFGEREEEQQRTKSADVELAEGQTEMAETNATTPNTTNPATREATGTTATPPGIAAATTTPPTNTSSSSEEPSPEGCSICTDDFILGQDQRVLPCNHRFHPACIDPWLLNVSGTCPLCRIDLRPQSDIDADDNSMIRLSGGEGGGGGGEGSLAPPLEGGSRRASLRRSFLIGLTGGIGGHAPQSQTRPERMTREERMEALRAYSRRRREGGEAESGEEGSRMTSRLRNAFRVRTRRTGEESDSQEGGVVAAAPATSDATRGGLTAGETRSARSS
ncbi:unnamed protein product [Zymoseptoria tritici ST99CH_1A5]|uniref:RING-type domain-containing protein n=1 Tax=Zymoseptoria tritici ST99CH_1A5 TaxID=1276529 RepID=A0A1Y6LBC3_ZYMTR|nr:unnamed protein product [Zymoseptoria tritici ST99CH_1A5]